MQTLISVFRIRVTMEVSAFQFSTTTYAYVDLVTEASGAITVSPVNLLIVISKGIYLDH